MIFVLGAALLPKQKSLFLQQCCKNCLQHCLQHYLVKASPMAFPLSDHPGSQPFNSVQQSILSQFQGDLAERLNIEQMFILIDGVLPFEACLYYQVLPLFLDGNRLNLGMVSPEDTSATDYVRRLISYHNYSLVTKQISSEALQATLSAYLNYSGNNQRSRNSHDHSYHSAKERVEENVNQNTQQTLVIDSPDLLPGINFVSADAETTSSPLLDSPAPTSSLQTDVDFPLDTKLATDEAIAPVPVIDSCTTSESPMEAIFDRQPFAKIQSPLLNPPPSIDIQVNHFSDPIEVLTTLSPKELLRELLGRVLLRGIGRLYFERHDQFGRVLWSQNGILQSVIDKLEAPVFQGVINELKLMAHLPLIPLQKPKQVEIERLYRQNRLLLRFRFMPSDGGEEATIQVLRGAALRFYQQQQLASLERDALTIAKQLQIKVNEIRDRRCSEQGLASTKLEALPMLTQLLHNIEEQLGALQVDEDQELPN
jgi:Type II secretion system (T2SS), protein E, N-terminal domain